MGALQQPRTTTWLLVGTNRCASMGSLSGRSPELLDAEGAGFAERAEGRETVQLAPRAEVLWQPTLGMP